MGMNLTYKKKTTWYLCLMIKNNNYGVNVVNLIVSLSPLRDLM